MNESASGAESPSPVSASRRRRLEHGLTRPLRSAPLPVLRGCGRGLRVRFGESHLSRTVRTTEEQVEERLLDEMTSDGRSVVYDVGANIGWYSLLAARKVGDAGMVVAFEPGLQNAGLIGRNASTNSLSVTVVPAAVSDRDGWLTFLDKGSLMSRIDKDDDEGQAKRRAGRNERVMGATPVPVVTLDSWIAQTGTRPPTLVKIDVEGAEAGVLRGMEQTLRTARPTLIIELHGTRDAVLDLLDANGYVHQPIEVDVPSREAPWWAHILARPRAA
jgi:FkbM family methyltransferase